MKDSNYQSSSNRKVISIWSFALDCFQCAGDLFGNNDTQKKFNERNLTMEFHISLHVHLGIQYLINFAPFVMVG